MAKVDITALNERTRQKIYPNDVEAITGQVLQDQLVDMNNTLAAGINSNDTTATDHERRLGVVEQKQKEDGQKIDSLDKEMGQVKGGLTAEVERAKGAERANANAIAAETSRAKTAEGANKQAIGANSQEITAVKKKQTEDGKRIDSLGQELTQVKTSVSSETARATAAEDALGKRIDNTYTKAETDEKIEAVAGSVYKIKGSVQNVAALTALQGVTKGDTYNVIDAGTIDGKPFLAGTNFVAILAGAGDQPNMWDPLGGTIDTTDFLKKKEAATTYTTIANFDKAVKDLTQNLASEEQRATKAEKANADSITAVQKKLKNTENLFVLEIPDSMQLDPETLERLKAFFPATLVYSPAITRYNGKTYIGKCVESEIEPTYVFYGTNVEMDDGVEHTGGIIKYEQFSINKTTGAITSSLRNEGYLAPADENGQVPIENLPVNVPNGLASLDAAGKVPINQIPTPEGGYLRPLFEKMPNVKYNPSTKLYDIWKNQGGISVTEEEMAKIYNNALPAYTYNIYCIAPGSRKQLYEPKALIPIAYQDGDFTEIVIGYLNTVQYIALPSTQFNVLNRIYNAYVLTRIEGILRVTGNVPTINLYNNPKLTWIQLRIEKTKPVTINMKSSPSIDYGSFRYIPNNVQGTTYSNITTISVDTLPYSLLTGTATEEQYTATGRTKEVWMKIVTDSTAKGITYTQALQRSEVAATRFRRALPEPTRVEGGEIIAATDKALHRAGSDVYFDHATLLKGETAADFVEIDREEALAIIEAKEAEEAAKYQPMEGARL